jgi:hypothetical protein
VVTGFRHQDTTSGKGDGNFAIDANIAKKPGGGLGLTVKADVSDELRVTTDGADDHIDKVREFLGADKYDAIDAPEE